MTQLVELQRRLPDFEAAGMKIFAVSYDPQDGLAEFARTYGITYDLLSDSDSTVITRFGILNTLIDPTEPDAEVFYGIPYPGTYIVDASGMVVRKYFNQHLATRDAPERLLDEAGGQTVLSPDAPQQEHQDGDVRVCVFLPGGDLKIELTRQLYCRLDIRDGLHIYAEPVPSGFVATEVSVKEVSGLRIGKPVYPAATPLVMEELGLELPTWEGTVDIGIPITATTELLNVLKPLDQKAITLDLSVRYQSCSTRECFLPRTVNLSLEVPLAQGIVPDLPPSLGRGLRVSSLQTGAYLAQLAARRQEDS
jgi:peroxiredoxin